MTYQHDFIRPYASFIRYGIIGSFVLPLIIASCTYLVLPLSFSDFFLWASAAVVFGIGALKLSHVLAAKCSDWLSEESEKQSQFLDNIHKSRLLAAIIFSAAISLFLELAMLRWQGTVFEFFAFYKNFGLLACVAGLGLGYALSNRRHVPLVATGFLLMWQFTLLIALRHGLPPLWRNTIGATPITEQVNMGYSTASSLPSLVAIYSFLALVFLLTVLTFIPVGQVAGRCMDRFGDALGAYGGNLLGSLIGVVTIVILSVYWTPPVVWFGLALIALLVFIVHRPQSVALYALFSLLAVIALSWRVSLMQEVVYSPYQILEGEPGDFGLTWIRAAGQYYQRILNLSEPYQKAFPKAARAAEHYGLPYLFYAHPKTVAIVGAGTGNDVAAALRANAQRVFAIEIDPAIKAIGVAYHPERPYQDPRVVAVINDARNFLRTTNDRFDLIVFGLLDSHTAASQLSSIRIDSYVYTIESFKEARARLNQNGVISLSFATITPELKKKLFMMMSQAFDGHEPICIRTGYDENVSFLQNKEGNLAVRDLKLFPDCQNVTAAIKSSNLAVDLSTDDWPFLYMPKRIYPISYLPMMILVLLETLWLSNSLTGSKPQSQYLAFFFLGAGFMLIETKAITELSLSWGNTWYVTAIVISSILIMAFIANLVVQRIQFNSPWLPMLGLVSSLILGLWLLSNADLFLSETGKVVNTVMVTLPILFSGLAFSTMLKRAESVTAAMGMNLLGSMLGGALEYHAIFLGYRALYPIAIAVYLLAWLCMVKNLVESPVSIKQVIH